MSPLTTMPEQADNSQMSIPPTSSTSIDSPVEEGELFDVNNHVPRVVTPLEKEQKNRPQLTIMEKQSLALKYTKAGYLVRATKDDPEVMATFPNIDKLHFVNQDSRELIKGACPVLIRNDDAYEVSRVRLHPHIMDCRYRQHIDPFIRGMSGYFDIERAPSISNKIRQPVIVRRDGVTTRLLQDEVGQMVRVVDEVPKNFMVFAPSPPSVRPHKHLALPYLKDTPTGVIVHVIRYLAPSMPILHRDATQDTNKQENIDDDELILNSLIIRIASWWAYSKSKRAACPLRYVQAYKNNMIASMHVNIVLNALLYFSSDEYRSFNL